MTRKQLLAAMAYNLRRGHPGTDGYVHLVAAFQRSAGLAVDGKHGPGTGAALAAIEVGDDPPVSIEPFVGNASAYPRNYADRARVLGTPGPSGSKWYRANVVERQGDDAFPGVPLRWYVKVHRVIEPYAEEAFRRAAVASRYEIRRCGSFNYRAVRFGKAGSSRLSSHSFAAAFDFDPAQNAPLDHDDHEGPFPQPFSAAWNRIWPNGVDEPFVRAFASCGFRWGGTYRGWADPMHFEWVGLPGFRQLIEEP